MKKSSDKAHKDAQHTEDNKLELNTRKSIKSKKKGSSRSNRKALLM